MASLLLPLQWDSPSFQVSASFHCDGLTALVRRRRIAFTHLESADLCSFTGAFLMLDPSGAATLSVFTIVLFS
jgi:hypothetical protein